MVRWQFSAEQIPVRGWDGQIVAYDRASGDTHCLDPVASAVFARIADGKVLTEGEIRDQIAVEPSAAEETDQLLSGALCELERLGLVRRLA